MSWSHQYQHQSPFGGLSTWSRKPKTDNEKAGKLAGNIQSALEQGMHPDEVGELVTRAIEDEKVLDTDPPALGERGKSS